MTRKAKAAAPAKRKRAPPLPPKRKRSSAPKRKRSSAPRRAPAARRRGPPKPGRGFKFEVSRVKLDRRGYDPRGKYFGANAGGLKLYTVRVIDRATDIYTDAHVRARTVAEAKADVMANMMRSIGDAPAPAPKHHHQRPAFSGASLGPSTVSPHRGERSFSERQGDLAAEINRVTRAAAAASAAGNYLEADRLGEQAEKLYARFERGVH